MWELLCDAARFSKLPVMKTAQGLGDDDDDDSNEQDNKLINEARRSFVLISTQRLNATIQEYKVW